MRRLLPVLLTSALIAAACGSDSDSPDSTTATTESVTAQTTGASPAPDAVPSTEPAPATSGSTTVAPTTPPASTAPPPTGPPTTEVSTPEVTPAALAAPGPDAVGVVTRQLPSGAEVEVWYPADESARGQTVSYSVSDFLPEAIRALVPETVDDTRSIDAARDAGAAADGPYPVVLFSHGASSFRVQSSVLAQHLASWGMVVASTDHASRDLENRLGGTAEGQPESVVEFRALRDWLSTTADDEILGGVLDDGRVALAGHSAGGGTIVQLAGDDGILGYVSYASGLGDEAPDVPSLFMAGELDLIVTPAERTVPAFEAAPSPSWLWSFADTGHLAFSDLCAVGADGFTLIDLAEAAGLGDFIDDGLRRLATDGCEDPNRPVEEVWPGIHQASAGFFRWVFGEDAEPIGLEESVVTGGVTVTAK